MAGDSRCNFFQQCAAGIRYLPNFPAIPPFGGFQSPKSVCPSSSPCQTLPIHGCPPFYAVWHTWDGCVPGPDTGLVRLVQPQLSEIGIGLFWNCKGTLHVRSTTTNVVQVQPCKHAPTHGGFRDVLKNKVERGVLPEPSERELRATV